MVSDWIKFSYHSLVTDSARLQNCTKFSPKKQFGYIMHHSLICQHLYIFLWMISTIKYQYLVNSNIFYIMIFIFSMKNIQFVRKSLFLTLASILSFLTVDKYENHNKLMKLKYSKNWIWEGVKIMLKEPHEFF